MRSKQLPSLIVADSERCPDLLYATQFFAPDPFIFLLQNGIKTIVLNDLEIDRGKRQAQVDEVVSYSDLSPAIRELSFAEGVILFLRKKKVRAVRVPSTFPFGIASRLLEAGIRVEPETGLFWKEREIKTEKEIRLLRNALRITEAGMARGMEVLKTSEPGPRNQLKWGGKILTSERLRAEIDSAVLHAGGQPANTIVAGGRQACDPHERGSGPLRAGELIILDIFPRDAKSGYYGDMTRTVVRGRANEKSRQLWQAVLEGQKFALREMKPGVDGGKIHQGILDRFEAAGFPTGEVAGRRTGFFHGTGHGLGLEIHEEPRFSRTRFQPGQVITVEPGLYYPEIGGARIEDVAEVTASGNRLLSRFPKELEI